jgi:adenylyltransferase/sulfurtransferase
MTRHPEQGIGQYEISVSDLKRRMDHGGEVELLDVREPYERELASIGGTFIPLSQLPGRVHELDSSREIVVYCHSGFRSARAVDLLREMGFTKVRNLVGGIDAWSQEVDPSVPRY